MSIFSATFACLNLTGYLIGQLATTELYFIYNLRDNFKLYWVQKGEWKII